VPFKVQNRYYTVSALLFCSPKLNRITAENSIIAAAQTDLTPIFKVSNPPMNAPDINERIIVK
jgi:hypothetical protein